jgi:hypothetical protein
MGWKSKFGKIGLKLAGAFIPGLSTAVDAIEEAMPGVKGPQKKEAAMVMAKGIIEGLEEFKGSDLMGNAEGVALVGALFDAEVGARNALTKLHAAREAVRAFAATIKKSP